MEVASRDGLGDDVTAPLWPCDQCDAPGVRNVGNRGYCSVHLTALYATFNPRVFDLNGVGLQSGPMRPEWGPHYADLTCIRCEASWTGPIGEPCWWCRRQRQLMFDYQAALVMSPPDVDVDDQTYEARMTAWGQRLARAVTAGIVDRHQVDRAWRREVNRRRAA